LDGDPPDGRVFYPDVSNALPLHAAGPIVAEHAAVHVKGCLIRVRNVRGEIEIRIDVATERRTFALRRRRYGRRSTG
jgi:hypothetical protein